jgi:hypothetical protein
LPVDQAVRVLSCQALFHHFSGLLLANFARAPVAQGKTAAAIRYAEDTRGLNQPNGRIFNGM